MSDIITTKANSVYTRVEAEPAIEKELSEYFKYKMPNHRFTPGGRKGWDGWIRLYSSRNKLLPAGLLRYLFEFAKERNYKIQYDKDLLIMNSFSLVEAEEYMKSLNIHSRGEPLELREYQITAFAKAIRYKRLTLESPTSSGKSLIIYCFVRYLLDQGLKQGLITVPTTSLVEQLFGDFADYSSENGWDTRAMVQRIYEGHSQALVLPVVISTWQSIHRLPLQGFFDQFDFVVGDEAHTYSAECVGNVAKKLERADYRMATTGTLSDEEVNNLKIQGWFGPITKVTTTKKLMDDGHVADLSIKSIVFKYPRGTKDLIAIGKKDDNAKAAFVAEMDYIVSHKGRNRFLKNLALSLKGNTLMLFYYVDKHGKILHELIEKKIGQSNRKLFFVHGGTETEDREAIRAITEKETNAIIVASFGVFSTGVNIRNLHNLIFASPQKSKIRTLQSIGRGLRLGDDKTTATLFDVADDFRDSEKEKPNFTLKHYAERMILYYKEKFKVSHYEVEIK